MTTSRSYVLATLGLLFLLWLGPVLQRLSNAHAQLIPTVTPITSPTPDPALPPTATPVGQSVLATPTRPTRMATEINHPQPGDAMSGFAAILGYASTPSFRRYELHLAVAGSESWQWLTTSFAPVYDDVLYTLDTTDYPDGLYDLRLRVLREDGNYTEAFLGGVEIRNARPPTATLVLNELGTAQPTPTPTATTPTVTPTPEFISNIQDGQGIFLPYNNGVIRGICQVIGTANGKLNAIFARYEVAISPATTGNWTLLESSSEQIWQDTIAEFDTRRFPDGRYDLRLRIVYENGNYDQYEVRNLFIANTTRVTLPTATPTPPTRGIFIPQSRDRISGTLSITGTATIVNFQRWELDWSPSGQEEWVPLVVSNTPVTNGLIARLDVSLLPPGEYDLRLRIYNWNNQFEAFVVRRLQLVAPTPTPTVTPFGTPPPPASP
jgi:hypothetical protein